MERNNENGATNGQKMLALEIEDAAEEQESLLRETSDDATDNVVTKDSAFMGRNAHGVTRRRWGGENKDGQSAQSSGMMSMSRGVIQGFLRTDLMSHAVYHLRNALLLGLLAFFVLVVLEWEGGILRSEVMEDEMPNSPHTFSYGGKYNRGHDLDPDKPKRPLTPEEEFDLEEEILDESVEKIGTWDIALENNINEQAHYLHDPEKSPFASSLYNLPDDELDERQIKFATRMSKVIEEFGVWNNPDYEDAFGVDDDFFEDYYYRDVPTEDFPDWAWQKDREYILNFLDEAQALVEATKEGIMQEYNHPNPDGDERDMFSVIIGDHDFQNGTAKDKQTQARIPGVAFLPEKAWNGLVQKLLHALITSDHFYVVVVGSGETYKGNNFAKTQVMQFNYIMEPIFHKLGMTLISRNMGMDASTAISALGGADILGETDILWHVQRVEQEQKPGEFDLLQKQAIMSGERVPIVFSPQWDELMQASKGKAWVGNIQPGEDFCQKTTMDVLPDAPACHNVHCDTQAWEARKCYVYDSVCWEIRNDWNPDSQNDDVGDQDMDHPGYRRHQLEGRKMTLLILNAIGSALDIWRTNVEQDKELPLPTELWHVGEIYEDIRESVMSLDRIPGQVGAIPACEQLLNEVDARICHVPMHAFTEWTPRVMPVSSGLLSIINNMVEVEEATEPYDGIDIIPSSWQLDDDELDVHMIAIAANVTPAYDDDLFGGMYLDDDWGVDDVWMDAGGDDDGDDDGGGGDDAGRRLRRLKKHYSPPKAPAPAPAPAPGGESGGGTAPPPPPPAPVPAPGGDGGSGGAGAGTTLYSAERLNIVEGSGWRLEGAPIGFCDGSAQSRCNRREGNLCLLANHNHYQGSVVGGPKNSWLTMRVPSVRHGIILARLTFVNGQGQDMLPSDFVLDYAVNDVVKSIPGSQLNSFSKEIVSGLRVFPFVNTRDAVIDGDDMGDNYDIAMRIRSEQDPDCRVRLSHIYFA